jgi:glycosyltransferase involved in cell wall biosynthesis
MPKVSVIIPTYNRAAPLQKATASVLSQTFQDFEVIVVDDASPDNTGDMVRSFGDQRIRYIRHEVNKGEGAARNTGILHSKGEYLAFLDDDDEWFPDKLRKQVALLDHSPLNVGVIYTGYRKIDTTTGSTLLDLVPSKRGNIFNDLLQDNCIATTTVLVRRQCFDKAGLFEEGVAFGADYDMWIRVSREFHIDYIKEPLVNYYIHGNNVTRNYANVITGLELQLAKYESFWAVNSKSYSAKYISLGVLYCYTGNTKKGRAALLKAVRLYPLGIKQYYNLLLSLVGSNGFTKVKGATERLSLKLRALPGQYFQQTSGL